MAGQEVVLEQQVQQQVELIKNPPQRSKAGRTGLSQNLNRSELELLCFCRGTRTVETHLDGVLHRRTDSLQQ